MVQQATYPSEAFSRLIDQISAHLKQYPQDGEALRAAVEELLPVCAGRHTLIVKSLSGPTSVAFPQIVYVQCSSHKMFFHLADGSELESRCLRISFSEALSPLLSGGEFVRCHNSYVVNLAFVARYGRECLFLQDGTLIPVSAKRRKEVKARFWGALASSR